MFAGAGINAAEIILGDAPLAMENGGFAEDIAVGFDEITPTGFGVVIPAIDGEEEAIGLMLGVSAARVIGDDDFLAIGDEIVVGVWAPEDIGRDGDQGPALAEGDGPGHDEMIKKDRAFVHAAVAIGVFEDHDSAIGLIFARAVEVAHIAVHFHDPETAIGVPSGGDRGGDEGF